MKTLSYDVPGWGSRWSFRPMLVDDLPELMPLQERGAVTALAQVFPQDTHPFPREEVRDRWRHELEEPDVAAYVATTVPGGDLVAFAARRGDELLHFGTAVETWGSGLAVWLHDELVATYPPEVDGLRLRVFVENRRARRFYEKLGWLPTGRESRSTFAPYPTMVEYTRARTERARQDVPMGWIRSTGRWDRDVREAMKGRPSFRVRTSAGLVAACLWDCGEDELADRALTMTADDLDAIQRIEAVYEDPSYPLPVEGQRITHRHVSALAAVAYFEGSLRPLARARRRPEKQRPERFAPHPPGPDGEIKEG